MCIPSSHARSFALAGWYQAFAATCLVARLWHLFAIASLLLGVEFDRASWVLGLASRELELRLVNLRFVVETSISEYWYVCTTNGDVPKENSTQ